MGNFYLRETQPDGSDKFVKLHSCILSRFGGNYEFFSPPQWSRLWGQLAEWDSKDWVMKRHLGTRKMYLRKGSPDEIYYKKGFFGKYTKVTNLEKNSTDSIFN